jgi:MOSC domain-containing protein YiiM
MAPRLPVAPAPPSVVPFAPTSDAASPDLVPAARLVGVFAGGVRTLRSARATGRAPATWRSAILKHARADAVHVGALGLDGDAQHDRRHHGGPTKAVLCYAASHYDAWAPLAAAHLATHHATVAALPGTHVFGPGAFGENLLLAGVDEHTVHLGDLWRVGDCVLRITEPRGPCGTLARRWAWPGLVTLVRRTARAGWYCAVETPGVVRTGDAAVLVARVAPAWPIARVFALLEARVAPAEAMRALVEAPGAHEGLRARCLRRLATPGRTR